MQCEQILNQKRQMENKALYNYDPPFKHLFTFDSQGVYRREKKVEFCGAYFNAEVETSLIPIYHWPRVPAT